MEEQRLYINFENALQVVSVAPPQGSAWITLMFAQCSITAKGDVMYTMPVDYAVKMQVSYTDAHGNPATVDGDVTWESSDDNIIRVQRDEEDTTICIALARGQVGQAQVMATADADLGEGIRELITTCTISVVAGEAVAGSIQPVSEATPIK